MSKCDVLGLENEKSMGPSSVKSPVSQKVSSGCFTEIIRVKTGRKMQGVCNITRYFIWFNIVQKKSLRALPKTYTMISSHSQGGLIVIKKYTRNTFIQLLFFLLFPH